MLKENPGLLSKILDMITKGSVDYVREQIKNGVDAIMIFDTWGGLLSGDNYEKFSLNYIQKSFHQLIEGSLLFITVDQNQTLISLKI